MKSFADRLKDCRKAKGLTQEALARAADLSLGIIRDYEQGKKEPTLRSARAIAKVLGVSLDVLAEGLASPPKTPKARKPRGKKGGGARE